MERHEETDYQVSNDFQTACSFFEVFVCSLVACHRIEVAGIPKVIQLIFRGYTHFLVPSKSMRWYVPFK